MPFMLQSLFPWIAAALALGVAFGLLACRAGQGPRWSGWGALVVLAFLAGFGAAALQIAPGRWGFQLETALAIFGAYGFGSVGGCGVRLLFRRSPVAPAPDWIAPAQAFMQQAEAFASAAPHALSALATASDLIASSGSHPSETTPPKGDSAEAPQAVAATTPEAEAAKPEPAQSEQVRPELARSELVESELVEPEFGCDQDDLALIHGLGRADARALRDQGLSSLAELARLTAEGQAEIANRLGRGGSVVAYWAAQARLLAHGVETVYAHAGASEDLSREGGTREPPLDDGTAQFLSAALPQVIAPHANDRLYPGERPLGLLAPPRGEGDDIQRMAGVGAVTAKRLNQLGIWTFRQIAAWSPDNERWVDSYLASPGRVAREHWREQAATLAGLTRVSSES
jgi:predicted flap endonuclease-1-like 5' DNA nuclease